MVAMSGADALGEGDAAALDADEAEIFAAVVLFDDLVGETDEGSLDLGGGHEAAFFAEPGGWERSGISHIAWG